MHAASRGSSPGRVASGMSASTPWPRTPEFAGEVVSSHGVPVGRCPQATHGVSELGMWSGPLHLHSRRPRGLSVGTRGLGDAVWFPDQSLTHGVRGEDPTFFTKAVSVLAPPPRAGGWGVLGSTTPQTTQRLCSEGAGPHNGEYSSQVPLSTPAEAQGQGPSLTPTAHTAWHWESPGQRTHTHAHTHTHTHAHTRTINSLRRERNGPQND